MLKKSWKVPPAWSHFWSRFWEDKTAVVGLGIVLVMAIIAVLAPVISPYSPYALLFEPFQGPSLANPMGTDNIGRDVLSGIIWGARVSMLVGFGAAGLSLLVGAAIGALSGYYGGPIDDFLMGVIQFFSMLPRFFLMILLVSLLGGKTIWTLLVIGLTAWPANARIVRAQVLSLREREFALASRALGASHFRVLFGHILPNGIQPAVANSTLEIAVAIIAEAGLSFLGLGDANQISWGQILLQGQYSVRYAWWLGVIPGLALFILVFGINLTSSGINYALTPQISKGLTIQE